MVYTPIDSRVEVVIDCSLMPAGGVAKFVAENLG